MAHPHHGASHHASADDEYVVTPPGSGHEHTDANVWIIVKFMLWLAVAAIVIHIGMGFVFGLFVQTREETEQTFPLAAGQAQRLPAGPRLQAIPVNEAYEFRLKQAQALSSYGWIDREAGRVQLPIAEAMRLTVERGLPARATPPSPPDAPQAGASESGAGTAPAAQPQPAAPVPGLIPADSSAGRTMERRRQ